MFVILAESRDSFVGLRSRETVLGILVDVILLGDRLK